jgi:hypothetical protein
VQLKEGLEPLAFLAKKLANDSWQRNRDKQLEKQLADSEANTIGAIARVLEQKRQHEWHCEHTRKVRNNCENERDS